MNLDLEDPIRIASVFSGAGGLDLGFSAIPNSRIILHLDNDSTAIETLHNNRGNWFDDEASIVNQDIIDFVEARQNGDKLLSADEVDVLVGGPPCQPFSAAARRTGGTNGTESDDGQLFKAYCALLKEWEPTVFLFENVNGITSNEDDWQPIQEAFNDAGYDVKYRTLDTADYGVPQHRVRTFIIGTQKDSKSEYHFPKPTHGPESDGGPPLNPAGEAINDIEISLEDETYSVNSKYADLLPEVPPGLNYSFFTEKLGHPDPKFAWRSRFSDFLYKAIPDEPVRTLKAQPGGANGPFHWNNRRFTEEELKRLQTFPDNYSISGGYSKVVEQIGNSVPPRIASVLARSIAAQLFDWIPDSDWNSPFLPYQVQDEDPIPDELDDDAELNFRSRKRTPLEVRLQRAKSQLGERATQEKEIDSDRLAKREFVLGLEEVLPLLEDSQFYECLSETNYHTHSVVQDETLYLEVTRDDSATKGQIDIELEANEGYLLPALQADQIRVQGQGVKLPDLVPLWTALVDDIRYRTNYEKLMSVVGHYSCARSNFSSDLSLESQSLTSLREMAVFFSNAENCNRYYTLEELVEKTGMKSTTIVSALEQLRELRYDIRTPATHSTIGDNPPQILCTYPFPNLVDASPFDMHADLVHLWREAGANTKEIETTL